MPAKKKKKEQKERKSRKERKKEFCAVEREKAKTYTDAEDKSGSSLFRIRTRTPHARARAHVIIKN